MLVDAFRLQLTNNVKQLFLFLLLVVVFVSSLLGQDQRPNFLIIMVDDQSHDTLTQEFPAEHESNDCRSGVDLHAVHHANCAVLPEPVQPSHRAVCATPRDMGQFHAISWPDRGKSLARSWLLYRFNWKIPQFMAGGRAAGIRLLDSLDRRPPRSENEHLWSIFGVSIDWLERIVFTKRPAAGRLRCAILH